MTDQILRPLMAALFLLLIATAGCKKEDGIGSEVIPDELLLGLNSIDSLSIESFTAQDDSVRSDEATTVLLGAFNDPKFGRVDAGFYTQLRLSTNQPNFAINVPIESLEVDSVVLALLYSGEQYGFNFPQNYEVYELNERLYGDSLYYSNRIMAVKPGNLVLEETQPQRPMPNSTITVGDNSESPPQLRLKLSHALADKIFAASGSDSLTTALFAEFFKGLYVKVGNNPIPSGNGGVHSFNLLAAGSKLTIYYREPAVGENPADTLQHDLLINTNAVNFTHIDHDFSNADPDLTSQINGDVSLGQQTLYIKAGAGLKARVSFPWLDQLNSDTMAINRAELIVPFELNTTFPPPDRLFAIGRTDEGTAFLLPDFFEGDAHVDGFIDPINLEYRINITRWAQQVIYGSRENDALEIVSSRAASTVNRVILHGPEHEDKPMRLVLHYTKI